VRAHGIKWIDATYNGGTRFKLGCTVAVIRILQPDKGDRLQPTVKSMKRCRFSLIRILLYSLWRGTSESSRKLTKPRAKRVPAAAACLIARAFAGAFVVWTYVTTRCMSRIRMVHIFATRRHSADVLDCAPHNSDINWIAAWRKRINAPLEHEGEFQVPIPLMLYSSNQPAMDTRIPKYNEWSRQQ